MVLKHITHHNYSIYYLNAVVLCVWSGWLGVLYLVLFIILSSNNNCGKSLVILLEKKAISMQHISILLLVKVPLIFIKTSFLVARTKFHILAVLL